MSSAKRQQTMAKRNRERAVEEKRTLKRLKKQAAKAEKAAGGPLTGELTGEQLTGEELTDEPLEGEGEAEPGVE
jgi:hypothetical protein